MSGIIANHAHALQWKRLSEAAILELNPEKLLERIVAARSAIHDRIEDGFSRPSDGEQLALGAALEILSTLRPVAEREISEWRRTGNLKRNSGLL
jgi:hypothetical protein